MLDLQADIGRAITAATGQGFEVQHTKPCSGGCIHQAAWWEGACGRAYFIKTNDQVGMSLFAAEAKGLAAIDAAHTIRVPQVICTGQTAAGTAFLVLEAIAMQRRGPSAWMGHQLAALHRVEGEAFGWESDNFIGRTPQKNGRCADWVDFFRTQRLEYQFQLAARKGLSIPEFAVLLEECEVFFENYTPRPSLLHGDLWRGNAGFTAAGEPILFDPAVYYGDRETDIAFTAMFGGFDSSFYQGYATTYPLDAGFARRKPLYNLYHELNHYNLFGGSYGSQAQHTAKQLVRDLR